MYIKQRTKMKTLFPIAGESHFERKLRDYELKVFIKSDFLSCCSFLQVERKDP